MKFVFGALFWLIGIPMLFMRHSSFAFNIIGFVLLVSTFYFDNARFFSFVGGVLVSALGIAFIYIGIAESSVADVYIFLAAVLVFGAMFYFGGRLPKTMDSSPVVIILGTGVAALGSALLENTWVPAIPIGLLFCIYGLAGFWEASTDRTVPDVWRDLKKKYVSKSPF